MNIRLFPAALESWEYGTLQLKDPNFSTLRMYYELLNSISTINGDVIEFGVWRGASLISTALQIRKLNMNKIVYGIDTFSGFPETHENDEFSEFERQFFENQITSGHLDRINKNEKYIEFMGRKSNPNQISTSGNFSLTNEKLISNYIHLFNLNSNIKLIKSEIKKIDEDMLPKTVALALLDVDLYESYSDALEILSKRIVSGGFIYLDEYYSLKFPGPRYAINEFLSKKVNMNFKLMQLDSWLDFERWALKRETT